MKKDNFFLALIVIFLTFGLAISLVFTPTASAEEKIADHEVIIVGGGISGLSAAFFLDRYDYDVLVLEKESVVGGRSVDGIRKGVFYAQGAEYLGRPEGALARIIHRVHVRKREIPGPMDAHFCDGEIFYGEDGFALDLIRGSGLEEFNRFVRLILQKYSDYEEIPEFDMTSDLAKLDGITAARWLTHNHIPANIISTYNVMARGLFGASLEDISALCLIPETAFDYEGFVPIRSIDDLDDSRSTAAREDTEAFTFKGGISAVAKAIADSMGKKIRCNATVNRVTRSLEGIFSVSGVDGRGRTFTTTSHAVIMAIPAPIALKVGEDVLNPMQKKIMEQIPYSTYATVSFFSDDPIFNKAFDLAVPDGWSFTDIYDSTWVQRHKEGGRYDGKWITTVYVGPRNFQDRFPLTATNSVLLKAVYSDLERIFPGVRKMIRGHEIRRFPYAYPVMTVGAYGRLTKLHKITGDNGLFLAGDYMIYPTFEAAFDSGCLAADSVDEYLDP